MEAGSDQRLVRASINIRARVRKKQNDTNSLYPIPEIPVYKETEYHNSLNAKLCNREELEKMTDYQQPYPSS